MYVCCCSFLFLSKWKTSIFSDLQNFPVDTSSICMSVSSGITFILHTHKKYTLFTLIVYICSMYTYCTHIVHNTHTYKKKGEKNLSYYITRNVIIFGSFGIVVVLFFLIFFTHVWPENFIT